MSTHFQLLGALEHNYGEIQRITAEQDGLIERALRAGAPISAIARASGMSRQTIYDRRAALGTEAT